MLDEQDLGSFDGEGEYLHKFLGGTELLNEIHVDRWVIDLPFDDLLEAQTEAPMIMAHLAATVLPARERAAAKEAARNAAALAQSARARQNKHHAAFLARWWRLGYRREHMLSSIEKMDRYISTSRVATSRRATVFEFVDSSIRPGDSLTVFALDDDYSLGVLSSRLHATWLVARCSTLKGDWRYTSTTVWDSFPWPQTPGESTVKTVVEITSALLALRAKHLERGVNLARQYNSLRQPGRSQLRDLHADLDKALYEAYGFSTKDDGLAQLFALNQDVATEPAQARAPGPVGLAGTRVTDYRRR